MRRHVIALFLLGGLVFQGSAFAQPTTVWVARHAEKSAADPKDPDPALNETGLQRAEDLSTRLAGEKILAVYATPYKRTRLTGAPLATMKGLTVLTYDPRATAQLVQAINETYKGGAVLLVGHSNTVLELVEVLGGKRPVAALTDDDYDYLFKVTLAEDTPAVVQVFQYGAPHHAKP